MNDSSTVIGDLAERGVDADFAVKLASYLETTRGNWPKCWEAVLGALPDLQPWEVTRWLHGHGYRPVPYSA